LSLSVYENRHWLPARRLQNYFGPAIPWPGWLLDSWARCQCRRNQVFIHVLRPNTAWKNRKSRKYFKKTGSAGCGNRRTLFLPADPPVRQKLLGRPIITRTPPNRPYWGNYILKKFHKSLPFFIPATATPIFSRNHRYYYIRSAPAIAARSTPTNVSLLAASKSNTYNNATLLSLILWPAMH
jgi:hypothetical protein